MASGRWLIATWPSPTGFSRGQPAPSGPTTPPASRCLLKKSSTAWCAPRSTARLPRPNSVWSLRQTPTKAVKLPSDRRHPGSWKRACCCRRGHGRRRCRSARCAATPGCRPRSDCAAAPRPTGRPSAGQSRSWECPCRRRGSRRFPVTDRAGRAPSALRVAARRTAPWSCAGCRPAGEYMTRWAALNTRAAHGFGARSTRSGRLSFDLVRTA